jgi:hypothetical protein
MGIVRCKAIDPDSEWRREYLVVDDTGGWKFDLRLWAKAAECEYDEGVQRAVLGIDQHYELGLGLVSASGVIKGRVDNWNWINGGGQNWIDPWLKKDCSWNQWDRQLGRILRSMELASQAHVYTLARIAFPCQIAWRVGDLVWILTWKHESRGAKSPMAFAIVVQFYWLKGLVFASKAESSQNSCWIDQARNSVWTSNVEHIRGDSPNYWIHESLNARRTLSDQNSRWTLIKLKIDLMKSIAESDNRNRHQIRTVGNRQISEVHWNNLETSIPPNNQDFLFLWKLWIERCASPLFEQLWIWIKRAYWTMWSKWLSDTLIDRNENVISDNESHASTQVSVASMEADRW